MPLACAFSTTRFVIATFFLERLVARVDHDGTVEARSDAIVTGFLVSVVEMHGKNYVGKHFLRCANHRFEHPLVGVFSRAFRELNDKRRLALHAAAEQPEKLFHVVNVIGADGEFSVGDFVKLSGGNDHRIAIRFGFWASKLSPQSENATPQHQVVSEWRANRVIGAKPRRTDNSPMQDAQRAFYAAKPMDHCAAGRAERRADFVE